MSISQIHAALASGSAFLETQAVSVLAGGGVEASNYAGVCAMAEGALIGQPDVGRALANSARRFATSADRAREWFEGLPEGIRQKADLSLDTALADPNMRRIVAFASVYKNKVGAVLAVRFDPVDEYFLEDLRIMKGALVDMDLAETELRQGIESGAFTWEEFWQGLWRGNAARGQADHERWTGQVSQARGDYAKAAEAARLQLWNKFEAMQEEMAAMEKELVRKIRGGEEAPGIAHWIDGEVTRLRPMVVALSTLNQKLFDSGFVEEAVHFAVKIFLHDKVIRDVHTLGGYALSILEGATGRLEKLLRFFDPPPAMLQGLFQRLVDAFYYKALVRGVEVSGIIVNSLPIQFAGHVSLELVAGVLSNLVENGIKYSDPAQPHRYVRLRYDQQVLMYGDNGIGMAPEFAARLGSEAGLRELDRVGVIEGTGTGWMIIARNLRALGWTWEIETAPGQGLKVRIHIPPEHLVQP